MFLAAARRTAAQDRFLFLPLAACLLFASMPACTSDEEKMGAIGDSGRVIYNGKEFPVRRVDEEKQVVYIIAPDGVAQTVPLVEVNPVK